MYLKRQFFTEKVITVPLEIVEYLLTGNDQGLNDNDIEIINEEQEKLPMGGKWSVCPDAEIKYSRSNDFFGIWNTMTVKMVYRYPVK